MRSTTCGRSLHPQGAEIALIGVQDQVARISLATRSCGGGGAALRDLVREQVLTFAPELSAVEVLAPAPAPALIPVTTLWQRPDRPEATTTSEPGRTAAPLALGGAT